MSDTRISVYCTSEDLVRIDVARGDTPRSTFLRELLDEDLARSEGCSLERPPAPLARALATGRVSVRVPGDMVARLRARVGREGSIPGHARGLIPAPAPSSQPAPRRDRASLRRRLAEMRRRALDVRPLRGRSGTHAMLVLRGRQPEGMVRVRIASADDLPRIADAVRAAADGFDVTINIWPACPDDDLDALEREALAETARIGARVRIDRRTLRWRSVGVNGMAVNLRLRRPSA